MLSSLESYPQCKLEGVRFSRNYQVFQSDRRGLFLRKLRQREWSPQRVLP